MPKAFLSWSCQNILTWAIELIYMCARKFGFAGYFSKSDQDSYSYLHSNFKNKNVYHKTIFYKNGDFTWLVGFGSIEEQESFFLLARLKGINFKEI